MITKACNNFHLSLSSPIVGLKQFVMKDISLKARSPVATKTGSTGNNLKQTQNLRQKVFKPFSTYGIQQVFWINIDKFFCDGINICFSVTQFYIILFFFFFFCLFLKIMIYFFWMNNFHFLLFLFWDPLEVGSGAKHPLPLDSLASNNFCGRKYLRCLEFVIFFIGGFFFQLSCKHSSFQYYDTNIS